MRQSVEGEESLCRTFALIATVFTLEDYIQEEEAQLVVRCVWKRIRMESTQQDSGGAARHKRTRGESFQGARGPARTF